ncbi:MAG: DNA cytosine methyltransferase [Bacteroidetes bacterium]|nr:DNA cytosine methyltransferase [Bacteroidota bacterium]
MKKVNFNIKREGLKIEDLLTLVSFFHGVSGMSKGAAKVGYETLYATDNWDKSEMAFKLNGHLNTGYFDNCDFNLLDSTRILEKINKHHKGKHNIGIGDIDCVVSGSPCQGQSGVNPHRSSFDVRNKLMVKQIRLAGMQGLRAKTAWFEQVPGFFDEPMKALRMEVLAALESQTDYTYSIRVLNALDYGSYQSRDRVTIIMVRKDVGVPSFPDPIPIDLSVVSVKAVLPHITAFRYKKDGIPKLAGRNVINTMTASGDNLMVFDGKRWRKINVEERQILSHLKGYNLSMFSEKDRIRLMGNMVQIPFAEAITGHIKSEILLPYYNKIEPVLNEAA